jgi:hypothetical protein
MLDLGSVYTGSTETLDGTGTPVDPTTISAIVTLPDLTTSAITPTKVSVGLYTFNYITTQAGRHVVNWTAASTGTSWAYSDVFDVRQASVNSIVSLSDVKAYLNIPQTNTTNDAELRNFIATATHMIEHEVGACSQRTVVEQWTGSWQQPYLQPRTQPVISVTSITERGTALVLGADFLVDDFGRIIRVYGGGISYPRGFWYGVNDIVITYVAGRTIIPSNILEAAKKLISVNWRSQPAGAFSPFEGGTTDTYGSDDAEAAMGFYMPRAVLDLLNPHADIAQGIA